MGKGRIVSTHGAGRYTIEVMEDRARALAARAKAQDRLVQIEADLAAKEDEASNAQLDVDQAADDQDGAIARYQQEIAEDGSSTVDLAATGEALLAATSRRDAIRLAIGQLKAQRLEAQTLIARIDALPAQRQIEAWCADLTENLTGEVATAEVPGEVGQVLIRPGYNGGASWGSSRDGMVQPALSGTPASVFYNLAMLPGWQKWRPTYRVATVSNVTNDLCDITLDAAHSSQQGLGVNDQTSYVGVPIMYMQCNGAAFRNGDRALVAFSGNTGKPVVVGFENSPRACHVPGDIGIKFKSEDYIAELTDPWYGDDYYLYGVLTSDPEGLLAPKKRIVMPAYGTGVAHDSKYYPHWDYVTDASGHPDDRWDHFKVDPGPGVPYHREPVKYGNIGGVNIKIVTTVDVEASVTMGPYSYKTVHTYTIETGGSLPGLDGAKFVLTSSTSGVVNRNGRYRVWGDESEGLYMVEVDWEAYGTSQGEIVYPNGDTETPAFLNIWPCNFDSEFPEGSEIHYPRSPNDYFSIVVDDRGVVYLSFNTQYINRNTLETFYVVGLFLISPDGVMRRANHSDRWQVTDSPDYPWTNDELAARHENVAGRPIDVEMVDGAWQPVY